jgi:hypothetical protein
MNNKPTIPWASITVNRFRKRRKLSARKIPNRKDPIVTSEIPKGA